MSSGSRRPGARCSRMSFDAVRHDDSIVSRASASKQKPRRRDCYSKAAFQLSTRPSSISYPDKGMNRDGSDRARCGSSLRSFRHVLHMRNVLFVIFMYTYLDVIPDEPEQCTSTRRCIYSWFNLLFSPFLLVF